MKCLCLRVSTDCCERKQPACQTVDVFNADGTINMRVCRAGHACAGREHHVPPFCGACACAIEVPS